MNVRQLRYFISVAEHLNFTEAAKKLYVAQPAVSQQISSLENQIGVKLFERTKHSVLLTNAGAVFLKEAKEIVQRLENAVDHARQAEDGVVGTIHIGLLSTPVRFFLPILVRQFRSKYPKVIINFTYQNVGQIIKKLQTDEIDIAFTLSHGLQSVGGLACRTLWTMPNCIILPHDHPLANQADIPIAQLAQEPFVMLDRQESPPGFDYILAMCANHGFSPRIVSQASRVEAVLMMVDAGVGITILPRHVLLYASPSLRFIDIAGDDYRVDVVASWKKTSANPSVPYFVEEMESALAKPHDYFSFMS